MRKILISALIFICYLNLFSYTKWVSPDGEETVITWKGDPTKSETDPNVWAECSEDNANFCRVVRVQSAQIDVSEAEMIPQGTRLNIFIYNQNQTTEIGTGTGYIDVVLSADYYLNSNRIDFFKDSNSSIETNYTVWRNAPLPNN